MTDSSKESTEEAPERPDLPLALCIRQDTDQHARDCFIRGDPPTHAEITRMAQVDKENTAWLETVVDRHGWPGFRLVGREASDAAWLLAQHADQRPELQRRWLPLLRAAVKAGDAEPRNLAYLEDRVATADRRPQRHGTQLIKLKGKTALAPLDDPQRVNEYRRAAGLEPLDDDEIAAAWPTYPER